MKKWFTMKKWLVMLLVLAASCVLFAACDRDDLSAVTGHEHEFSDEWTYDETYHWHAAVCEHTDVVSDHRKHAYADGKCTECGADSPTLEAWVSIDVGGGAELKSDELQIKTVKATAGQSVKSLLTETPTAKTGFTFKGWYIGDEAVTDQTVPKTGLTVTAKYTVGCTVKVYKQATDGTYGEPETVTEKGTFGDSYEYVPSEEHFSVDYDQYNRLTTDSLTLDDEFAVYLKLDTFDIVYHDVDGDFEDTWEDSGLLYGSDYVVEDNVFGTYYGYRFAGWATEEGGEVSADYAAGTELTVSGALDLYAVWDVAYEDRAGGYDYIYVPQSGDGEVILERGESEFTGTIDDDGVFTIETEGAKLVGKIDEATHTFMYEGLAQEGTYLYYDQYYSEEPLTDAERINDENTLVLNKYGEGTLTLNGETYEGVCFMVEGGEWLFYVDMANRYFFVTETVGDKDCFTLSGDEYGEYSEFISTFGFLVGYDGDGLLTLDGYGHATMRDSYHREDYDAEYCLDFERSYVSEDLIILCVRLHVFDFDGWLFGKKTETQGEYVDATAYCILSYDEEAEDYTLLYVYEDTDALGTFTKKGGEDTLELDGFGLYLDSATLTEGGEAIEGSFFSYESEVLGTIVEFEPDEGALRYFRLYEDKTYEELSGKPTEYVNLHIDEFGIRSEFGNPYLVMYGEDVKNGVPAEVYIAFGAESDPDYKLVAKGTCKATEQGDYTVYTLTVSETVDEESPFEKNIVFVTKIMFNKNEILVRAYYIFETDGEEAYKTFIGTGRESIVFVTFGEDGIGAFYTAADGTLYEGSFTVLDGDNHGDNYWFESDRKYGIFRYADEDGNWAFFYFALRGGDENGDNMSFTAIDSLPKRLYMVYDTYNYDPDETLCIGPDDVAQYRVLDANKDTIAIVEGTYTAVDETVCGDVIYRFEPETNNYGVKSFEFVLEYGYVYGIYVFNTYHVKDTTPEANFVFEVDDGSTLTADGFWYKATYDGYLGELEGILYNGEDEEYGKVLYFETEEYGAIVFDILPDGTLTMRDGLDGYFDLIDENSDSVNDWVLALDGYGNLIVYEIVDAETMVPVYEGYYEMNAYGIVETQIEIGNTMFLRMDVVLFGGSDYVAVLVDYASMGMYVASDLSMLYLDGMNVESFYIDELGNVHYGAYYLFDEFGVFEDDEDTMMFSFTLNAEDMSFEKMDPSAIVGTYYSADMLEFYDFGTTAIFNNGDDEYEGFYYAEETKDGFEVTMYLVKWDEVEFTKSTATLNKDGVLTVGYVKDYYKLPDEVTLTGTATFGGGTQIEGLTLTFTLDDIDGSIYATLSYESVEFEVEISGWGSLYMYYQSVEGYEQSPEIDFNLKTNSFTIACENDNEINALKAKLGITA